MLLSLLCSVKLCTFTDCDNARIAESQTRILWKFQHRYKSVDSQVESPQCVESHVLIKNGACMNKFSPALITAKVEF